MTAPATAVAGGCMFSGCLLSVRPILVFQMWCKHPLKLKHELSSLSMVVKGQGHCDLTPVPFT